MMVVVVDDKQVDSWENINQTFDINKYNCVAVQGSH